MEKEEHKCIVGLLHPDRLVTWDEIVQYQKDFSSTPLYKFADKRYNVGVERFSHCPFCGKYIDWETLRKETKDDWNKKAPNEKIMGFAMPKIKDNWLVKEWFNENNQ